MADTTIPEKPDSGVVELQKTLTNYATATGFTPANPGTTSGLVDDKTIMAVAAVMPRVPGIPSEVKGALALGPAAILLSSDLRDLAAKTIKGYAGYITKAIIALGVYQVANGGAPTQPPPTGTTSTTHVKSATVWAQHQQLLAESVKNLAPAAPPVVTPGGVLPGDPKLAIWYYDSLKRIYRVAVPRPAGLSGGYQNYIEAAPSASKPAFGTEVTRMTFAHAIGSWWATPTGMVTIGGGVLGAMALTITGMRAIFGR